MSLSSTSSLSSRSSKELTDLEQPPLKNKSESSSDGLPKEKSRLRNRKKLKEDKIEKEEEKGKAKEAQEKVEWSTDLASLKNQKKIQLVIETLEKNFDNPSTEHTVLVEFFLQSISGLDSVQQTAVIDLSVQFWWIDRSLVGKVDGEYSVGELTFRPDIEVNDNVELEKCVEIGDDNHSIWTERIPNLGNYSDHGIITSWQRFKGTIAAPMYLKDFPFDAQKVKFTMNSDVWAVGDMRIIDITSDEAIKAAADAINMDEWGLIGDLNRSTYDMLADADGRTYSTIKVEFTVQRRIGFYMQKVIFVLFLLGVFMAGSFFVPPETLNDRFQIALTLLLSTVAFNFVTSEVLPKISYLTMIDKYFFGTYIFLAISVVEHIAVYKVHEAYGKEFAVLVDYIAIGVFLFIFMMWTAIFLIQGFMARRKVAKRAKAGRQ